METIEKLNKEFDMLYKVYDSLFDILEHAGHDTETKYKKAYIDLLQSAKELNSGLYKLLEDHSEVIMDVEYEVERVPAIPTNSLANHMANEAIGAARRTGQALGNVS